MDDPRELLRKAFPSYGPDWDAAIDAGVDVSLLEENLRLTPTERLEQLQRMTELYEALRPKEADDDAGRARTPGCSSPEEQQTGMMGLLQFIGRPEDAELLEAHRPAEPILAKVFDDAARALRGLREP